MPERRWSQHARVQPRKLSAKPLGRRAPTDDKHLREFPLSALPAAQQPKGVPVTLGVNWYTDFDNPVLDGTVWWIGRDPEKLGTIRGGHCVCLKPGALTDPLSWWRFYDQGSEGACEGFGHSRLMSLLNRRRYNAWWLWDHAKLIDEWGDTNPGDSNGTSGRASCEVLRTQGHVLWKPSMGKLSVEERDALPPDTAQGISAYRWATTVEEVLTVLDTPTANRRGAVPILNSWGRDYPHIVWMPGETLARLIREDGEVALVTDR